MRRVALTLTSLALPLALAALPRPARAQLVSSLEAGVGSLRTGDVSLGGLVTLSPALAYGDRAAFDATGTLGPTPDGRVASRGDARLRVGAARVLGGRVELGATSGWDALRPDERSGFWHGEARWTFESGAGRGLWVAGGAGQASAAGESAWGLATTAGAGAWLRLGGATLRLSLANARVSGGRSLFTRLDTVSRIDSTFGDTAVRFDTVVVDSGFRSTALSNTDASASLAWGHGPLALELSAGHRLLAQRVDAAPWASARVMLWLNDRLALVGSGGRLPAQPAEGRPATHFAMLTLHVAPPRERGPTGGAPPARPSPRDGAAAAVDVADVGGAMRRIALRIPGAHAVDLMGDFTAWEPVALEHVDDRWVATLPIAPGMHRLNVRVDGGEWIAPPGLPSEDGEFGASAVLVVR